MSAVNSGRPELSVTITPASRGMLASRRTAATIKLMIRTSPFESEILIRSCNLKRRCLAFKVGPLYLRSLAVHLDWKGDGDARTQTSRHFLKLIAVAAVAAD